ncbi:hypothetical protein [Streptomyces sp. NPDC005017]|uniref:hypothetical protein n=1 Tax=Streptomyces sp. NPDC005017 TaxID=3364706 RepID=UPI0036CA56D2
MRIYEWTSELGVMEQSERGELIDRLIERFALPPTATSKDACRRVGEVLSEHLQERVEVRFVPMRGARLSGATARYRDGSYVVYCVSSPSWYHRLGVLLHELAHLYLGHEPVVLDRQAGLRQFAPNLPARMARIIAGRTDHTRSEEREAEEFADELLERLTNSQEELRARALSKAPPCVTRIAEGLTPSDHALKRGER